jgi:predicted site-specific integrase-resolvase
MKQVLTILETAVILGITTTTLRRWDKLNKFKPEYRTIGGHRRYLLQNILKLINPNIDDKADKITLCYSRVSSYDQKEDLKRQSNILLNYCEDKQLNNIELIEDLGSGLNFKKKGLKKLIKLIINSQIDKIILTHKDRLLRFGSDLLINLAKEFNIETIILNEKVLTFEQELSQDVLEIITVFSARLYGSRSHKNKIEDTNSKKVA